MKVKTYLGVLIEEGNLTLDDFDEPHLEADLSNGEGEVSFFWDESYECIASIL